MKDKECVQFLQWALPQLHLRWKGFRKVRQQACKRIQRRLRELGLSDVWAYQSYLATHNAEWLVLDACCRITISRFYRDRAVFDYLRQAVLPELIQLARARGDSEVYCWSAGCASGEEVYTLKIIWNLCVLPQEPNLRLRIVATDANAHLLQRAKHGCYDAGSLKELPSDWLTQAFSESNEQYCIQTSFREGIDFEQQDIRAQMPEGSFHLVLCRNLVFTYFEASLQREVLQEIVERSLPGGFLVIGVHESLPSDWEQMLADMGEKGIYRFSRYCRGGFTHI